MDLVEQGKELAQQGQYDEALKIFKQALEEQPKDPDILFFVGTCHSSMGDFPTAKYYYQEALQIDPDHSRTRMVWKGLDGVEARPPEGAKPSEPLTAQTEQQIASSSEDENQDEQRHPFGREPSEERTWSEAFPDTMLESKGAKAEKSLGIWIWIAIVIVVAAVVYYYIGPQLFE